MFPIKHTKRLASRLFSRQKSTDSEQELAVKILQNSGKFDAKWYLAEYEDIAREPFWSENPELHYYKVGAKESRNPCSWFDTEWYLCENQDVVTVGMNPLVHYILHGAREGRSANSSKVPIKKNDSSSKTWHIRQRLSTHLWGGLSELALHELTKIKANKNLKSEDRWLAAWHISRWWYFHSDFKKTYELAKNMDKIYPDREWSVESVYLKAFCLFSFQQNAKAANLIEKYILKNPENTDALFALSNAHMVDDSKRLELINTAYRSKKLLPLSLVDQDKPLSIGNVTSKVDKRIDENTKVSIIIPAYNAENRLHIAVDSLLNQTWINIEVIIVDDYSPDSTYEIAKQYAQNDPRVIALQQERNGGAYRARNKGLGHATGDFITTHDSDDWSHPQKLEMQVRHFELHPEKVGICTNWIRAKENLFFTQNWRPNDSLTHWSHSSFMFRKSAYDELGGWNNVRVGGDTEFIWRIKSRYGANSYELIHNDIPFALALDDEGSLTRTKMTHVKTVYFGLRHIYREICAWKHSQDTYDNSDSNTKLGHLSVPIPRAMFDTSNSAIKLDALLIADFSDEKKSKDIYKIIEEFKYTNTTFGLFHWPSFAKAPSSLCKSYFKCLSSENVFPIVSGETITCGITVFSSCELINYSVDALPVFSKLFVAYILSGESEGVVNEFSHTHCSHTLVLAFDGVVNCIKQC